MPWWRKQKWKFFKLPDTNSILKRKKWEKKKIRKKKENPVYAAPRKPVTTVLHKPFRVHTMLSSASNDRHGDILATTGSI